MIRVATDKAVTSKHSPRSIDVLYNEIERAEKNTWIRSTHMGAPAANRIKSNRYIYLYVGLGLGNANAQCKLQSAKQTEPNSKLKPKQKQSKSKGTTELNYKANPQQPHRNQIPPPHVMLASPGLIPSIEMELPSPCCCFKSASYLQPAFASMIATSAASE